MKRGLLMTLLLVALLPVANVAQAQHGGGCACGTPATPTMNFQVEISGAYNLAVQAEMAKWNRHVDVFRPVAGDGAMGANGTNEIGFLGSADTAWFYGYSMGSDVLGVTVLYPRDAFGAPSFNACPVPPGTACGTFTETDIVLNKGVSGGWAAAGYPDFNDASGPASVNATALHELGHALGLHHNFGNLSTMNYFEDFAGWYLSLADASAAREHLPARAQSVADLATYPFVYENGPGTGYVDTETVTIQPGRVARGSHVRIQNFSAENVGTADLSNVVMRFYLTADRNVTAADHELGSLTFPAVPAGSFFDGAGLLYFRIPDGVPAGDYYVGARIAHNGTTADSVAYNNAWASEDRVTVTATFDPAVQITGPTTSSFDPVTLTGTVTSTAALQSILAFNITADTIGQCTLAPSWSCQVPLVPGANEIIVTAYTSGYFTAASDAITVTLDNTRPTIAITRPDDPWLATAGSSIQIAGTASDEQTTVTGVTWTNDRGGSGNATGTSQWNATVPLLGGTNLIEVTATDGEGKSRKAYVAISRDMTAPSITLYQPTTETTRPAIDVYGIISDDVSPATLSWSNDRGGSGTMNAYWDFTVPTIPLQIGVNVITFTATDVVGRTGTLTLTITRRSDTVLPVAAITRPAGPVLATARPALVIVGTTTDNEEAHGIQWSDSNGNSGRVYGSPWSFLTSALPFGTTILTVRPHDRAGNTGDPTTVTIVRRTAGDTGGDGKAELLWRKQSSGETTLWTMNGRTVSGTAPLQSLSSAWSVVGIDDFNADGRADVLWRNTNGQLMLWRMHGVAVVGTDTVTSNGTTVVLPPVQVIEAVGDFNGDAKADVLVRNSGTNEARVWLMDGAALVGNQYVAAPPMQWSVQGVGDMSDDGKADILWRNSQTNEAWAWLMNGATIARTGYVASPPSIWSVQGVGDFTADGRADILWRNSDTNQVVVWEMYATTILGTSFVAVPSASWQVRAVGDFNGDRHADVMWRNTSTGENAIWLMFNTFIRETGFVTQIPDQGWTVVGPR